MRIGLFVFGVIFLAVGGLLYFIPNQTAQATVNTPGSTTVYTATASAGLSFGVMMALLFVGVVLLVLGLAMPSSNPPRNEQAVKYDSEKRETTVSADGRKTRTTYEKHVTRKQKE